MSGPDPETPPSGESNPEPESGPGVLGSLPRTRPAVRSPRRAAADPKAGASTPGAEHPDADPREGEPRSGREAEIEALARAGASLAGEAATLGLRFAGRAAAALRDAVERR